MSSRTRPAHRTALLVLLLASAASCSDAHQPPTGRYRAQDATGGSVTLDFIGESDVRMGLGDGSSADKFARVCSFTFDGDSITIRDGSVKTTMELELEDDTLVGEDLVFRRE